MAKFEQYKDRFKFAKLERQDGILELTIHHNGGSALWDGSEGAIHEELGEVFYQIAHDPENKVMIFTGAGDDFVAKMNPVRDPMEMHNENWERVHREGRDLLNNLMDIDVPIVGAVNGPALIHAELVVLSDIVIAAEHAVFADKVHAIYGVTPSDGVHTIWPMLLGPNRGRHFLLTGAEIDAQEALRLGVVAEVLPKEKLRERAWEIARDLAKKPRIMLRHTRMALTHDIKRRLFNELSYGLVLEGLAEMKPRPKP